MDSQREHAVPDAVVRAAQYAYAKAYGRGQDVAIRAAVAVAWSHVWREAADIARRCLTCGQPHQPRLVTSDNVAVRYWSWAHPGDGHPYRRPNLAQLAGAIETRANQLEDSP